MKLVPYSHNLDDAWDSFVVNDSRNGGIFHERKFLSYHPEGRFEDTSIAFFSNNRIVGVLPAAKQIKEDGKVNVVSHPGSTMGGLIYHKKHGLRDVLMMLEEAIQYYKDMKINSLELRIAEPIFSYPGDGELTYLLWHRGFALQSRELSSCIYLQSSDWTEYGRKRNLDYIKSLKRSGVLVELTEDVRAAYALIENNLDKRYQKKPTHSLQELLTLKQQYPDKINIWIARFDNKAIVTVVTFVVNTRTIHVFYIAQDYEYSSMHALTLLFSEILDYYKKRGFQWFNFGISSRGDVIKWGILEFKEHIGGRATFREIWSLNDLLSYQPYTSSVNFYGKENIKQ
jgi:hypothetical protein